MAMNIVGKSTGNSDTTHKTSQKRGSTVEKTRTEGSTEEQHTSQVPSTSVSCPATEAGQDC